MIIKLLIEHHLEFQSLKGGCRGSSESKFVKMSNCWKSHATAQILSCLYQILGLMHAIPPIFDSLLRAAAFFMFKQWLSIKTFGRRVHACWVCFQIKK